MKALIASIERELKQRRASEPSLRKAPVAARAAEIIGFRRGLEWVLQKAKRSKKAPLADVSLPEALYRLRESGYLGISVAAALLVIHNYKPAPTTNAVDPAVQPSTE